jgi:GH24 family phage-related lysozyme (muramidase)
MTDIYHNTSFFVAEFEGLSLEPYFCPAGKITIGYGEIMQSHRYYDKTLGEIIIRDCLNIFEKNERNITRTNNLLKKNYKNLITEHDANIALMDNLKSRWRIIAHSLPIGLTDNQCVAILSFVYNLGTDTLLHSTLLRKVKKNPDDASIAKEFNKFVYAGGKRLSGLIKRRRSESNLYFKK